ncbi:uncharacterized protein LOC142978475 [Anticarsia gemmatalis]|uniref:uncharacterized protein LOC142978475 n=1 Tax=Anticarsia gemmatalis TaxID=129554 RepID=UPI003F75F4B6
MGCTSSAQNMANSSTAEKSIQFEDESSEDQSKDVEEIIYRAANDTNVLPSCDTLPEPVHLVRNKSTPSFINEKDKSDEGNICECIKKVKSSDLINQEDNNIKVSSLEELVERVVEKHQTTEPDDKTPTVSKNLEEYSKTEENTDKHSKDGNDADENKQSSTEGQETEKEETPEEKLSPSQSESSRATRWEALADIAAELPPSLKVDPITGQIFVAK